VKLIELLKIREVTENWESLSWLCMWVHAQPQLRWVCVLDFTRSSRLSFLYKATGAKKICLVCYMMQSYITPVTLTGKQCTFIVQIVAIIRMISMPLERRDRAKMCKHMAPQKLLW
jgi:hypothetical protein